MFRTALLSAAGLAAAAGLGYGLISYGTAQKSGIDTNDRAAIEAIVRDYLLENPDVVVEALDRYSAMESMRDEAAAMAGLDQYLPVLISGEDGYAAGPAIDEADVVVIEFFDYHCGFCKQASGYVADLLDDSDDVRVVFRELPVLREESDLAAQYALAARDQNGYPAFHFALMDANGVLAESRIREIAADVGLDAASLAATVEAETHLGTLSRTRDIAIDLRMSGTPAFVVASPNGSYSRIIPGWQPQTLDEAIEEARQAAG